ncbi:hypothetical protein GCM10009609_17170 [Pseudonocardia aurantiaca]|uniref:ATP-grasp target RiPP n=1 Tax=Pseudonocardia aurantiaca TaxID=75290 RepID=A0ABW4FUM8_9PSEU
MTTTPDRLTFPPVSPMIAAGSRFPIEQLAASPAPAGLSEPGGRSFLLRFAEPVMASMYGTRGSTPKTTTGYDGQEDNESEDFNQPDFAP